MTTSRSTFSSQATGIAVPPAQWVPGLLTTAKILSYGGFAQYDLRNDSEGLTKGAYFYTRVGSSKGLKNKTAFSDYGWLTAELEARGYIPLGGAKTSLALRGYATLKDPRGGSQIPFYELPFLGGQLYGRGFKSFRFRGNNMLLASAELRRTVRTQSEERGLDVFGFGDAGQVWGDNRSQTDPAILVNQDFDSSNWRAFDRWGIAIPVLEKFCSTNRDRAQPRAQPNLFFVYPGVLID
jgi:outer membrane protein assembly factor BamA